jgi:methylene-tetrahydromethanopterin dehydrogenase
MSTDKRVMIFLDTDKHASPFDILLLAQLFPDAQSIHYGNVTPDDVQKLVQDSIFPRGPEGCKNTKLFIGGSDVEMANKIVKVAKKSMFPPFELATIIDPRGAHTTGSGAVAKTLQVLLKNDLGDFKGKNVTVLAATGPVGIITSSIFQSEGANVTVTSRKLDRALNLVESLNKDSSNPVKGVKAASPEEVASTISDAEVIMAAGSAGIQLISQDILKNYGKRCKVVADVNAVPPVGVENLDSNASGVEIVPGVFGIGALAIGALKNKVEAKLIEKAMEFPKGIFDYVYGYQLAKDYVLKKLKK